MTLATADVDLRPSARIVLLKGFDARGFVFFTNYASRKGHELAAQPAGGAAVPLGELERQVRIEGIAGKVDEAESDAYFAERPRPSRLGAWASPQSQPVAGRAALETRFAASRSAIPRRRRTHSAAARTGAATGSCPKRSNSGRGEARDCTIAYAIGAISNPEAGSSTGWHREPGGGLGREPASRGPGVREPPARPATLLAVLIPLGIASHTVLAGSRVIGFARCAGAGRFARSRSAC